MDRLRVGVIGLGRLWASRHRPALEQLKDRFRVVALYDQVEQRAKVEADRLGCRAAQGLSELVGLDEVDVVYLLEPQWFGVAPIPLAARRGKPVYCVPPLFGGESDELKNLAEVVERAGIPLMLEYPRRFHQASVRLQELLLTRLGPPRLLNGQVTLSGFDRYETPGPDTQVAPVPLLIDPVGYLIDWCRWLFQAEPRSIARAGGRLSPSGGAKNLDNDFEEILLQFPDGGVARLGILNVKRRPEDNADIPPRPGFRLDCERGSAWLETPAQLWWSDEEGTYNEHLPVEPGLGVTLNDHFFRCVRGEASGTPTLEDALKVDHWIRSLRDE